MSQANLNLQHRINRFGPNSSVKHIKTFCDRAMNLNDHLEMVLDDDGNQIYDELITGTAQYSRVEMIPLSRHKLHPRCPECEWKQNSHFNRIIAQDQSAMHALRQQRIQASRIRKSARTDEMTQDDWHRLRIHNENSEPRDIPVPESERWG